MRVAAPRVLLDGEPSGLVAWPCERFLARTVGCWRWGGRLPRGMAVWLAPCRAIHTIGLPRSIEVAFCDRAGCILRLVAPLVPHRLAWCPRASGAFELRTGSALRLGLCVGRRLHLEPPGLSPGISPGPGPGHGSPGGARG